LTVIIFFKVYILDNIEGVVRMIIRNDYWKNFDDNYFTKNRRLKLEEYDDDGNLIDVIEFNQADLWTFYIFKNNFYNDFDIARKKDRGHFEGKKLELAKKMLYIFNNYYFDEKTIKDMEEIFGAYTLEQIEFALNFKDYRVNEVTDGFVTMQVHSKIKTMKFIDILNWLKNSEGIYYAISNDGKKGMSYFEKPTKKQAKYQRQKNGRRIIFLSFKDWKEYLLNENELD